MLIFCEYLVASAKVLDDAMINFINTHDVPELERELCINGSEEFSFVKDYLGVEPKAFDARLLQNAFVQDVPGSEPCPEPWTSKTGAPVFMQNNVSFLMSIHVLGDIEIDITESYTQWWEDESEQLPFGLHPFIRRKVVEFLLESKMYESLDYDPETGELYCDNARWFDMISPVSKTVYQVLVKYAKVLFTPMNKLIKKAGYTQKEFAYYNCIPLRTVSDWCAESVTTECKPYLRLMIGEKLGLLP